MGMFEHVHQLDALLQQARAPLSKDDLGAAMQCCESTITRTLRELRNHYAAPLINHKGKGYTYDKHIPFALPSVFFSPEELHALFTMHKLLQNLSGGYFDQDVQPIAKKLQQLLNSHVSQDSESRIRILSAGTRLKAIPCFAAVTQATLDRKQCMIDYQGRATNTPTTRQVSFQRLVYYKGGWFADAFCHQAKALRTFAIDRISAITLGNTPCTEIEESQLDHKFARSFGIFSGAPTATAILHFTEKAARWVAEEAWYPEAKDEWLDDGSYQLHIPYSNPTELIMDICRYGPDVEVLAPPSLRQAVALRLRDALARYATESQFLTLPDPTLDA